MPADIPLWPESLLRSTSTTFALGSLNGQVQPVFLAAARVFSEPFDRRWVVSITSPPMPELEEWKAGALVRPSWREVEGRIAALRGMSRGIRIYDPENTQPAYNLEQAGNLSNWSDGRTWSDGRQWLAGFLPPFLTVDEVAPAGATEIVVRGLPSNVARVLRWGDRFELRPNGIPQQFGCLHMIEGDWRSNSDGKARISFGAGLHIGANIGDMVLLKRPTVVASLLDDKQGIVTRDAARNGNWGFSLIERLRGDA